MTTTILTSRRPIIAILGSGTMGAPIARGLLRAGFEVRVWNRTQSKAEALVSAGAHCAGTPTEAAADADVLITMLTDGAAVEQVTAGPRGALGVLSADAIWVQMSTVGPDATGRLHGLALRSGVTFVDAPVSGSSRAAEQGQLEILAAGPMSVQRRLESIFEVLGRRTVWLESVGDGSRLKLALNNWLSVMVEGMAETLAFSSVLGLDPRLFLSVLAGGSLASDYALSKGAAMVGAEFTPGFPLRHATKDAELAVSAAHQQGLNLPLTSALLPRWHQAVANGHGDDDVASAVTMAASVGSSVDCSRMPGAS
jgi:3-hydroxyisobutyrate dehydrogenase